MFSSLLFHYTNSQNSGAVFSRCQQWTRRCGEWRREPKNSSFKLFVLTPTFLSRFHFIRLIRLQFVFCLDYVLRGWNWKGGSDDDHDKGKFSDNLWLSLCRRTFLNKPLIGCGFDERRLGWAEADWFRLKMLCNGCQVLNWSNQSIKRNLNANFLLNASQYGHGSWWAPKFNKNGEQRRLHLFKCEFFIQNPIIVTKLRAIRQVNTFFSRLRAVTGMTWTTCYWKRLCNWSVSMI